jgi:hypothetical protein
MDASTVLTPDQAGLVVVGAATVEGGTPFIELAIAAAGSEGGLAGSAAGVGILGLATTTTVGGIPAMESTSS